jgi:lipoprotein-releasing system permease protein
MYKMFLCWRYLRTRYIALVSIISVTLGVATMIVVNSVMQGFSTEMRDRLHGVYADVTLQFRGSTGMPDPDLHMRRIKEVAGNDIQAMTPTVMAPAVLNYRCEGQWVTYNIQLIGVDAKTQNDVSDCGKYLQHPDNRRQLSFDLHPGGYDTVDHQANDKALPREQMEDAGWVYRRRKAALEAFSRSLDDAEEAVPEATESVGPVSPFAKPENVFDPAKEQHSGAVVGIAIASYRTPEGKDRFRIVPGDDVKITFPNTASQPPKGVSDTFTVVDFYESKMSEYDSKIVFVPIERLQKLCGMIDPETGIGAVTSIQIKVKPGVDPAVVRDKLNAAFSQHFYAAYTWEDAQSAVLQAVDMEIIILNILLFMIIAVAGFGILAIFYMVVVEKTRDIGILKSLGASGRGVMGIFLAYGLSLGLVGSGVGMILGLLFVAYINEIADLLGRITGRPIFSPDVYYFYEIPTLVHPFTVAWIVLGAMAIAVAASVLPARRAAKLHPVEALRYE